MIFIAVCLTAKLGKYKKDDVTRLSKLFFYSLVEHKSNFREISIWLLAASSFLLLNLG